MRHPFSAWHVGAPYYVPPLVVGLCLCLLAFFAASGFWYAAVPFLVAGISALYFFRDPPRRIPVPTQDVVSPADGTVVAVEDLAESDHYGGPCKRISIFLSVFSVHVNRAPSQGQITEIRYKPGGYMNAMKAESSEMNESNAIWMTTPHGPMTVRQISGAVARRIVCVPKEGENLEKGQKIGMIKFGSRTELYLPAGAAVCVKPKDKVRGGSSVVARMG